jgi:hypothetical protein
MIKFPEQLNKEDEEKAKNVLEKYEKVLPRATAH